MICTYMALARRVLHQPTPYRVREWVGRWWRTVPIEYTFPMERGRAVRVVGWFRLTFRWCGKRVNHWRRPRRRAR